jgi:hypothetical protein
MECHHFTLHVNSKVQLCLPCTVSVSSAICLKDQVGHILPQLLQLEEGLQTYGLLRSIRAYPAVWETVLVIGKGHQITANSLIDSFDIQYSESQVKCKAEADTHTYFCDFIDGVAMNGKLI